MNRNNDWYIDQKCDPDQDRLVRPCCINYCLNLPSTYFDPLTTDPKLATYLEDKIATRFNDVKYGDISNRKGRYKSLSGFEFVRIVYRLDWWLL